MTIRTGAASRDPSTSPPHPLATEASPAARRALLACALGWLFDRYESCALFLVESRPALSGISQASGAR
jgi:hypothetical protein